MAMRYVFKTPSYDETNKAYAELARFIDQYTFAARGDRLVVNKTGLAVIKETGGNYQVGCDDGMFRVTDGFVPVVLDETLLVDIVKGMTDASLGDFSIASTGFAVIVEPADRPAASKVTKAKKTKTKAKKK